MISKSIFLNDVPRVKSLTDNKLWDQNSHVLHEIKAVTYAILTENGLTHICGSWRLGRWKNQLLKDDRRYG